jgi:hypothetical protein
MKKLKAPALAGAAARLARDKGWLPKYLRLADVSLEPEPASGAQEEDREPPGSPDPRTLAEAMRDAIDADEGEEA